MSSAFHARIPGQCGNFFDVPEAIVLLYRGVFSIVCNTLSLTICNAHRERLGLNGGEINPRVVTQTTM